MGILASAKMWMAAAAMGALLSAGWMAWSRHSATLAENERLRETVVVQKREIAHHSRALEVQREAISKYAAELRRKSEIERGVDRDFADSREDSRAAERAFDGHDVGRLAAAKPGLVERIVNEGLRKFRQGAEGAAGAR